MQNKTDKGTLLVSRSLPVKILNFINCLFSERNGNCYAYMSGTSVALSSLVRESAVWI